MTYSFRPYHDLGVDSAPSENEYQEHFLGVKAAGAWGWQPHHLNVPNVMEIWGSKPSGTLWATLGLLRDSFTFIGNYENVFLINIILHKPGSDSKWYTFYCIIKRRVICMSCALENLGCFEGTTFAQVCVIYHADVYREVMWHFFGPVFITLHVSLLWSTNSQLNT
jgi:hypothetical protein